MTAPKKKFKGAATEAVESVNTKTFEERDNEDEDVLDEESNHDEYIASQLFVDEDEDGSRNEVEKPDGRCSGEGFVEDEDDDLNVCDDISMAGPGHRPGPGPSQVKFVAALYRGLPKFYDYPAFNDISHWLKAGEDDDDIVEARSHFKSGLYKGRYFVSKDAVIRECQVYSVRNRVEYKVVKSEPRMINLKCRSEGGEGDKCKWHLRAVKKKKSIFFVVSVYEGPHTCAVDIAPKDNFHVNKSFIAWEMKELIKENVRISPQQIRQMMKDKYGFDVSYLKAWKAKQEAIKINASQFQLPLETPDVLNDASFDEVPEVYGEDGDVGVDESTEPSQVTQSQADEDGIRKSKCVVKKRKFNTPDQQRK